MEIGARSYYRPVGTRFDERGEQVLRVIMKIRK